MPDRGWLELLGTAVLVVAAVVGAIVVAARRTRRVRAARRELARELGLAFSSDDRWDEGSVRGEFLGHVVRLSGSYSRHAFEYGGSGNRTRLEIELAEPVGPGPFAFRVRHRPDGLGARVVRALLGPEESVPTGDAELDRCCAVRAEDEKLVHALLDAEVCAAIVELHRTCRFLEVDPLAVRVILPRTFANAREARALLERAVAVAKALVGAARRANRGPGREEVDVAARPPG